VIVVVAPGCRYALVVTLSTTAPATLYTGVLVVAAAPKAAPIRENTIVSHGTAATAQNLSEVAA
jgi:hypothetical protein